jgi:hypothetical protein
MGSVNGMDSARLESSCQLCFAAVCDANSRPGDGESRGKAGCMRAIPDVH